MKVKVLLPSSHQNTPVSTLLQSITPWGTGAVMTGVTEKTPTS